MIRVVTMPASRKPKKRTRYGIGEWYGLGFEKLSPKDRWAMAQAELATDGLTHLKCPFQKDALCNKKGGICSLRLYGQVGESQATGEGGPIATCPNRFQDDGEIYTWVGETLLGTSAPVILSEIGFLDRLRSDHPEEDDDKSIVGRIDNVLLHPAKLPLEWCALEVQAVYFSGKAMSHEFKKLASRSTDDLPFPAVQRRPDWRSSGPKRLLPQLQTKTPTIRTWGKKIAVVVDEPFFCSLVGLDRERHLSNAEIAWFVAGYEETKKGWQLIRREVVFTTLESSVKALTGGRPLSKEAFENQLLCKLRARQPKHPLLQKSPPD